MAHRPKRLRSSDLGFFVSGDELAGDCDVDLDVGGSRSRRENGVRYGIDISSSECGSFASRWSVRTVHEVVSKFGSHKRELVKSIGFGGILHFPPMKQIFREFSKWLMTKVHHRTSTIKVGNHICIRVTKFDVGHVFGVPWAGKPVLNSGVGTKEAKERVINSYLGSEFKEHRSIKIVQEIVERDYGDSMSKVEVDRFKVAFVVFVVSNLFCPSAKYDYASVDYWNAIQDPDDIKNYDWCGYVLQRLLEAVSKLKQDIDNNVKFPNITGCALFLQVIYLDSLDLDGLSLSHDTLPRIRVFSFDTIRNFMQADKNFIRHVKGDSGLPIGKLRDPSGCIYSWALENGSDRVESRIECMHSIWETAVAMVHFLGIPLEAAGPLYVAVADFQEQMNSGLFVTGNVAVKFLSVLVTILTPYTRGFRYEPSYGMSAPPYGERLVQSAIIKGTRLLCRPIRNRVNQPPTGANGDIGVDGRRNSSSSVLCGNDPVSLLTLDEDFIGDDVQRSIHSAVESIEQLPDYMDVNMWVASIMAKFYYIFRTLRPQNDFDLNANANGDLASSSSSSSSDGSSCDTILSPWELGYIWLSDEIDVRSFFDKLNKMERNESLAVVHRQPKYLQVMCRAMCAQLKGSCEMEVDLFDALVRALKQVDDATYVQYGALRWRHIFESDFMAVLLSGSYDVLDTSIREHLSMSNSSYDLKSCKLVFFPALLHHQWVCFAWYPARNLISVFDPSHAGRCPEWRCPLVERACCILEYALFTLSKSVFHGVDHDVRTADIRILNIAEDCIERVNRSGVLCSMFYRCFDGCVLSSLGVKADVDLMAAKLFAEIQDLKGNCGCLESLHK